MDTTNRIVRMLGVWVLPLILMSAGCEKREAIPTIGVTQIATHSGIDAVRDGFVQGMKEAGYEEGKNVSYDFQNAQGQMSVAYTIAQKFVADKVDLIFSISTPSSQAVAKATKSIPIVFGAVTDPVSAGLVDTLERPGGNVTGVSDVWPVEDQIKLLLRLVPTVKTLGIVYNPGESNSQYNVNLAESVCQSLGLKVAKVPVSATGEVLTASQSLIGRVDAFYAPADNTILSAIESVVKVCEDNKIPLLVGDAPSVERGGFGTIGNNYFEIGRQSAGLAAKIIHGESPANLPVLTANKYDLYLNLRSAAKMGVSIPDDLVSKAREVYR